MKRERDFRGLGRLKFQPKAPGSSARPTRFGSGSRAAGTPARSVQQVKGKRQQGRDPKKLVGQGPFPEDWPFSNKKSPQWSNSKNHIPSLASLNMPLDGLSKCKPVVLERVSLSRKFGSSPVDFGPHPKNILFLQEPPNRRWTPVLASRITAPKSEPKRMTPSWPIRGRLEPQRVSGLPKWGNSMSCRELFLRPFIAYLDHGPAKDTFVSSFEGTHLGWFERGTKRKPHRFGAHPL